MSHLVLHDETSTKEQSDSEGNFRKALSRLETSKNRIGKGKGRAPH